MDKGELLTFLKLLQEEMRCHYFLVWGSTEEKLQAEELHASFVGHSTILERLLPPCIAKRDG